VSLTYTLRHRPTGTEEWTEVTGITDTTHELTGLTPGVRYDIAVIAVAASGASSTPLATQRSTRCAPPPQPSVLPAGYVLTTADDGTNGALATSWDTVDGAVSYEVRTRPTGVGTYAPVGDPVAEPEAIVTGLDGTASYDVEITAVNQDGDVSDASTARTNVPARIATGGTVTTFEGNGAIGETDTTYVVHTFTTLGASAFTLNAARDVDHLVVAGGGGGGGGQASNHGGGGGGAGGLLQGSLSATASVMSVSVGAGGARGSAANPGLQGGASSLGALTALGGGGGASYFNGGPTPGGSGGGGASSATPGSLQGASGTGGQGSSGGSVTRSGTSGRHGGGGGGAAASGGTTTDDGTITTSAGVGGAGSVADITGIPSSYAGGGGGGGETGAAGGVGGGGNGGACNNCGDSVAATGRAGAPSSGGGGGGGAGAGGSSAAPGGAGGSGIVVVRYALLA
jgi:hypothetical protein